ncbi:uncharacterized protein LOC143433280 [Xylocopa sonorina]|uniref:uncharacterized protein LOC143433280 n=1 Tax=Xylocopa sonorina TaxID=1818115 RepID=UPI00403AC427
MGQPIGQNSLSSIRMVLLVRRLKGSTTCYTDDAECVLLLLTRLRNSALGGLRAPRGCHFFQSLHAKTSYYKYNNLLKYYFTFSQINQTLLKVHEELPSACLNDTEIELLLRTICDYSFQYYSLREIDEKRYISDRLPGSIMVTTSADGLWAKKLRDLCHYYLDEIGEVSLYEQWQQWCNDDEKFPDLINVMCRSTYGILRDCRSMEDTKRYESPFKAYNAKAKITATYDKYDKRD